MNAKESHDDIRKRLWADLAVAYTQAANSQYAYRCKGWCDEVLKDFDERFPAPPATSPEPK